MNNARRKTLRASGATGEARNDGNTFGPDGEIVVYYIGRIRTSGESGVLRLDVLRDEPYSEYAAAAVALSTEDGAALVVECREAVVLVNPLGHALAEREREASGAKS